MHDGTIVATKDHASLNLFQMLTCITFHGTHHVYAPYASTNYENPFALYFGKPFQKLAFLVVISVVDVLYILTILHIH